MPKTYHFLTGLPRTGSTVLASILNQNPQVYVTPTSPMLSVTVALQTAWSQDPHVQANRCEDQIINLTRATLHAYWQHRHEPIIIDKSRGWSKNMPVAASLFGYPIRAVSVERDLPSIMASWLTILRKNPGNSAERNLLAKGLPLTDENLMIEMWVNMVKDCMEGKALLRQQAPGQFIVVNYDDLIEHPSQELAKIESFLNLPSWSYQFDCIVNNTVDDDLVAWGLNGLHTIRPKLTKTAQDPRQVLGESLYVKFSELEQQYT